MNTENDGGLSINSRSDYAMPARPAVRSYKRRIVVAFIVSLLFPFGPLVVAAILLARQSKGPPAKILYLSPEALRRVGSSHRSQELHRCSITGTRSDLSGAIRSAEESLDGTLVGGHGLVGPAMLSAPLEQTAKTGNATVPVRYFGLQAYE